MLKCLMSQSVARSVSATIATQICCEGTTPDALTAGDTWGTGTGSGIPFLSGRALVSSLRTGVGRRSEAVAPLFTRLLDRDKHVRQEPEIVPTPAEHIVYTRRARGSAERRSVVIHGARGEQGQEMP